MGLSLSLGLGRIVGRSLTRTRPQVAAGGRGAGVRTAIAAVTGMASSVGAAHRPCCGRPHGDAARGGAALPHVPRPPAAMGRNVSWRGRGGLNILHIGVGKPRDPVREASNARLGACCGRCGHCGRRPRSRIRLCVLRGCVRVAGRICTRQLRLHRGLAELCLRPEDERLRPHSRRQLWALRGCVWGAGCLCTWQPRLHRGPAEPRLRPGEKRLRRGDIGRLRSGRCGGRRCGGCGRPQRCRRWRCVTHVRSWRWGLSQLIARCQEPRRAQRGGLIPCEVHRRKKPLSRCA
mmetsp:Transcript_60134/g.193590  ORF Transcript_60134/g.193590 Transcript_60134/m.193590 type:complete len:291 (+) Transcript_60134:714-1586(+)